MGFTERVMHLTDYDRASRQRRVPATPEGADRRISEPRGWYDRATHAAVADARSISGERRQEFDAGHPRHVPETWPALLSRDQLCAYIGVSASTLTHTCPVRPLDMGANLVRYSRLQIDDWVATLPPRLMVVHQATREASAVALPQATEESAETRTESALDRVRARAGGSKWRKKV